MDAKGERICFSWSITYRSIYFQNFNDCPMRESSMWMRCLKKRFIMPQLLWNGHDACWVGDSWRNNVGCRDDHMVTMDRSTLLLRGAKWAIKKLIYIGDCNGVWGYNCIPPVGLSNCCPLTWAFCSFQASIIAKWVFLVVSRLPWSRKIWSISIVVFSPLRKMHLFLEGLFFKTGH